MSKPPSLSRRDFLSFLRSEKPDSSKTEDAEILQPAVSRRSAIAAVFGSTLAVMLPSIANAQGNPRFDLLGLLDPNNSGNFAAKQNSFDDLRSDQQPYLWPCDDVRKKDKDKLGVDVPSPSIVFEAQKRFEKSAKSRSGEVNQRLEHLRYMKRVADSYLVRSSKTPNVQEAEAMEKRFKDLKWVMAREVPLNTYLSKLWQPISTKSRALRKQIKNAVTAERNAGINRKRCAVKQADISSVNLGSDIKVRMPALNTEFDNYSGRGIPGEFVLEGYRCTDVGTEDLDINRVTSSAVLEQLKYLEKQVSAHLQASAEREEDYLQAEIKAKKATGRSNNSKRARLNSIYKNGRRYNGYLQSNGNYTGIRKQWEAVMSQIREIKTLLVEAEQVETNEARLLNRCNKFGSYSMPQNLGPVEKYRSDMNHFMIQLEYDFVKGGYPNRFIKDAMTKTRHFIYEIVKKVDSEAAGLSDMEKRVLVRQSLAAFRALINKQFPPIPADKELDTYTFELKMDESESDSDSGIEL